MFSKSKNNAINFITIIAAFGVIVGSASLFIVLSGFAGLKDFSLQFSSFVDPDLKVLPAKNKSFDFNENLQKQLNNIDGIASYSKIIEDRVILNCEDKHLGITLKGVDENYATSTIDSILIQGQWLESGAPQIVSGWGITNELSFGIFDFAKPIKIYAPKPGKGQISSIKGAFNTLKVANVGVFQINEELDNSIVYTTFDNAKYLFNYNDDAVSAIELILSSNADIEQTKQEVASLFGDGVIIKNRFQLNDALYKMLNTENLAVYLIFTLILIIALFNVIGSIIMMILDKQKNIATLYNLGATLTEIKRIFFYQGSLMSVLGGVIGIVLGFALVAFQLYGPESLKIMITPSLAYPVTIKPINFLVVFATISVLGIIASKIASSRINSKLIK